MAVSLICYFENIFIPIGVTLYPAATHLDARREKQLLEKVFLSGSKLVLSLAIVVGAIAATWSGDFFRLWIGPNFSVGSLYAAPETIFCVLLAGSIVVSGQKIGFHTAKGTGAIRSLAVLLTIEASLNLLLSLVLIRWFGLVGTASATAISTLLVQGLVLPVVLCRHLQIPYSKYLTAVWLRPSLLAGVLIGLGVALRAFRPQVTCWAELLLWGALTAVCAFLLLVTLALDSVERKRFLLVPMQRLLIFTGALRVVEPETNDRHSPTRNLP